MIMELLPQTISLADSNGDITPELFIFTEALKNVLNRFDYSITDK